MESALEALASDENRLYGRQIALKLNRLPNRLPTDMEFVLFRAIQDLIEQATSQAHANHFEIHLQSHSQRVELSYVDNGTWEATNTHLIKSLHQRLLDIGGGIRADVQADTSLQITLFYVIQEMAVLTPREHEVLTWVAQGYTNKEVAVQLHLSTRTVSFHLDNIFSKLDVHTRTEATLIALKRGWIQTPKS